MSYKEYLERERDLDYLIEKVATHADYGYFAEQLTFAFEVFYGPISRSLSPKNFRKLFFTLIFDNDREDHLVSANSLLGKMQYEGMEAVGLRHIVEAKALERSVEPKGLLKILKF